MGYGIKILAKGPRACFTRPEMKSERVSYDCITPSAARGLIEAVYWKPAIRWHIDRIHVLNEIRFDTFRRNELGGKMPYQNAKKAMEKDADEFDSVEIRWKAAGDAVSARRRLHHRSSFRADRRGGGRGHCGEALQHRAEATA